jgi:hypothetical protein
MKQLVIEPVGGLCNRIFVLNSALEISKKCDVELTILWWNRADCGCDFQDVLIAPEGIRVINKKRSPFGTKKLLKEKKWKDSFIAMFEELNYKNYQFWSSFRRIPGDLTFHLYDNELCDLLHKYFTNKNKVYLEECMLQYGSCVDLFPFSDEVYKKAKNIKYEIGKRRYYGLHIRRTDHVYAIQNSPTELFVNEVEKHLKKEPDCMFFLATDDKKVENFFREQYPNNIIYIPDKAYGRNGVFAIQDAALDLLLLSQSEKIYGSVASTFSIMAAAMGKIELCILMRDGKLDSEWQKISRRYLSDNVHILC